MRIEDVFYIEAGFERNYVILNNGDVYSWGSSRLNNLGYDTPHENVEKPNKISSFTRPIKKISPGWYHSLALDGILSF